MGHRANYAIRRGDDYDLYYSQWGALTVPSDLFWGPDYAEAFIRQNTSVSHDEWLDDVSGEGGAVLDKHAGVVHLFGGEQLAHPPYRDVFVELMEGLWKRWTWTIEWADWGMPDLARQVGEEPMALTSGPIGGERPTPDVFGARYERQKRVTCLVSVVDRDESAQDRVSGYDGDDLLVVGPAMLDGLERLPALERARHEYDPPEHLDSPEAGLKRSIRSYLVVDYPRKVLDFRGHVRLGELAAIEEAWGTTNWEIRHHADELDPADHHFASTGREVPTDLASTWEPPSRDEIIDVIADRLFEEREVDPADNVRARVEQMRSEGRNVDVSPHALESPVDARPDEEVRQKRFGWALAAVMES